MTTPTCPNCGSHEFRIDVLQTATVRFDADDDHEITDDPHGDILWDDNAYANCNNCDFGAPLNEMLGEFDAAIKTLKAYGGQIYLLYSEHEELRVAIATVMPDFVYDEWASRSVEELVRQVLGTDDEETI